MGTTCTSRCLMAIAALCLLGCSPADGPSGEEEAAENTRQPEGQLEGASWEKSALVVDNAVAGKVTIVIAGAPHVTTLASKVHEILAGKALKEKWYRGDVPADLMPSAGEEREYDLAAVPGIDLMIHHERDFPPKTLVIGPDGERARYPREWVSLALTSVTPPVTGKLRIKGAGQAPGGFAFVVTYRASHPEFIRADGSKITLETMYEGTFNVGGLLTGIETPLPSP